MSIGISITKKIPYSYPSLAPFSSPALRFTFCLNPLLLHFSGAVCIKPYVALCRKIFCSYASSATNKNFPLLVGKAVILTTGKVLGFATQG